MPSSISLMIPAIQLHQIQSIVYSFWQDRTSPGKRLLEKNIQGPQRAILKNFVPLNCGVLYNRVKSPCVRDTNTLKAIEKLDPWRRNEHHKTHTLLLQVHSSISLSFVPESHKVRILFLKKIQPTQQTPLKKKGAKRKQLCPVMCTV